MSCVLGKSFRVNVHFLVNEGWTHIQKYPYGSSFWVDLMDLYDKNGIRVISCDGHSSVLDMRVTVDGRPYPITSFDSAEELKYILNSL